jgi:protocatechuate 3,4-dioxygenase beta subunit
MTRRERSIGGAVLALIATLGAHATAAGTGAARSAAVLVPDGEPGDPLVVSGVVYRADGKTPWPGVKLHVYNTDAKGHYSPGGENEREHRLAADLETDGAGRYEFRTIRPATYPGTDVPAHVHYVLTTPDGREQRLELRFRDDPLIPQAWKDQEAGKGRFAAIQATERGPDGVLRCSFDIALD